MMPTPTYDLIASNVLSSSASSVTFSSIPATYRDLVIVTSGTFSGTSGIGIELNGDAVLSNYRMVAMGGSGSSTASNTDNDFRLGYYNLNGQTLCIGHIFDYSATDKHKVMLSRANPGSGDFVQAIANRWANTAAVTSIKITNPAGQTFSTGHTFHLYGIVG